ncbi:hypothetical protein OKW48_002279 [Paraburkholderia youngii]|uniref:hypothetical protein n=1 Tax=Paraburkholderia youngii TaxID=2782701 RepID=UPI003D242C39
MNDERHGTKTPRKALPPGIGRFSSDCTIRWTILLCVRWYVVYSFGLRNLEE